MRIQADESLRLHRERLRQATENQQRDVSGAQRLQRLRICADDFEASGKEVLAKWNEELNASGARASQASSEAIGQASEWFQEEARARLQVIVEQSLGTAGTNLDELASQAAAKHADDLNRASGDSISQVRKIQIDNAASDAVARSHSQFDDAAQAAAASFGQVLRNISDHETQQFYGRRRRTPFRSARANWNLSAQQAHREFIGLRRKLRWKRSERAWLPR